MNRSARFAGQARRFRQYYQKLSRSSGLEEMAQYPQHGSTSRLLHSVAVAYFSYRMALFLRVSCRMEEMVRGALLHDYFFYDAQDGDPARKGHWRRHPSIALENAGRELELTDVERDVIEKHMFPLTLRPPRCREALLVTLADKACSVYEFFTRSAPYSGLRRDVIGEGGKS